MTEETKIKNECIAWLRSQHIWVCRVQAASNNFGLPDTIGIFRGYFLGIEFKTPKGVPTDIQRAKLTTIYKQGGIALVIRSLDELKNKIEEINKDLSGLENWEYFQSFKHGFDLYEVE